MEGGNFGPPGVGINGGGYDEQNMSVAGETFNTNEESISDLELLNMYCAAASPPENTSEEARLQADRSWERVREWLRTRSPADIEAAAKQRGDSSLTALHLACRNGPPIDVIETLLSVAAETTQWPDSFSWLPIHYACACGADTEVIKKLAEAFPESKTTVDRRGRTPLHFALGSALQLKKHVSPEVVALLSNTGAAGFSDDNGMLPLHYACAYGASEEALGVLTQAFAAGITATDHFNRLPLHFALSNAGQSTAPVAVRHLLSLNKKIVSYDDGGSRLPLLVLAEYTSSMPERQRNKPEARDCIQKCLEHLLNSNPEPTAAFFTALQALPDWLSEKAVVMPVVQNLLNDKIAQRFPAAVLMLDFYFIVLAIVFYFYNVNKSLDARHGNPDNAPEFKELLPLYLAGAYFLIRDGLQVIFQAISRVSLESLYSWFRDLTKILNLAFILVIFFWTVKMHQGENGDRDFFRIGTSICVMIPWLKLLAYLRKLLINFAVFVGGLFFVIRRLAAFLISLVIILIAFTQIFYTVFQNTEFCNEDVNPQITAMEVSCENYDNAIPFCNYWNAFLHVYTMLLGEVDDGEFDETPLGLVFFILYMILVVILLANVLIAIVTDSYKVIQDQRAAIVFWTNRLDFVAEMDVIANGPWKANLRKKLGWEDQAGKDGSSFGSEAWSGLTNLFTDEVDDGVISFEFLLYMLARLFVLLFVIPLWFLLGIVTAGWFWPPQIRVLIFTSTVLKHNSESEKEDELRKTQVMHLEQEVQSLKDELYQQLATDRTQVVQMKSNIAERKVEIANEIKAVKRIMTMLFEQQSGAGI